MSDSTIALVAVAVAGVANVVLQVLAKIEAAKVAAQQKADAALALKAAADLAQQQKIDAVKAQESAAWAAQHVTEVKAALVTATENQEAKLEGLAKVARATHTLVNSSMSAQLKISAIALRRVAELTKSPIDKRAADLAEHLLAEHEAKQVLVDAQPGTDDEKKGRH